MDYIPKDLGDSADASSGDQSLFFNVKTILIFLMACIVVGYGISFAAKNSARWVPDSWEVKAFDSQSSFLGAEAIECDQFPQLTRLSGNFKKFIKTAERKLNYRIRCVSDSLPNAFAFPGGAIVLTSDLLENIKSEVGLAFVVGHEIGHHEQRHILEGLSRRLGASILTSILGLHGLDSSSVVSNLQELSFSRDAERGADKFGLEFVNQFYPDKAGITEFFEYVQNHKELGGPGGRLGSLFTTHPYTKDRIKYILDHTN